MHPRVWNPSPCCAVGLGLGLSELVRRTLPSQAWVGAYEGPITSDMGTLGPNSQGSAGGHGLRYEGTSLQKLPQ